MRRVLAHPCPAPQLHQNLQHSSCFRAAHALPESRTAFFPAARSISSLPSSLACEADVAAPVLELENVCKNFGSVVAVENISLSVFAGEVMCLLGDNGAGKSTVIKIISGVHQPSSGALRFEGAPRAFGSPRVARL